MFRKERSKRDAPPIPRNGRELIVARIRPPNLIPALRTFHMAMARRSGHACHFGARATQSVIEDTSHVRPCMDVRPVRITYRTGEMLELKFQGLIRSMGPRECIVCGSCRLGRAGGNQASQCKWEERNR
jgi:hypothetical protein